MACPPLQGLTPHPAAGVAAASSAARTDRPIPGPAR